MPQQKNDRVSAWARLIEALGNAASKIVWSLVAIVIFATVGRNLYLKSQDRNQPLVPERKTAAPVQKPIQWHEVDKAIVDAFKKSHRVADEYATAKIDVWAKGLEQRIDEDFLEWYFSYFQQQWLGLKAIGYWTAEKVIDEKLSMAEKITEDIQEEFAKRVLRPEIAQMQIERIANETITEYVRSLEGNVGPIPEKYDIPQAEWDRYLSEIALMSERSEGNREVSLSLKTVTTASVVGGVAGATKLAGMLKPAIAKIGTKVSSKTAAKGAGKAIVKLAAKTGSKVGAKAAGKFLGPIIGVGVLIWDAWDHHHTKDVERPILRENLLDYLEEMKHSLLRDPEAGIITMIDAVENMMVSSLRSAKSS